MRTLSKEARTVIIFSVVVFIVFATRLRVVRTAGEHILIFTIDNPLSWTLQPKTLHMVNGDIRMKLFTQIYQDEGIVFEIYNDNGKKVKYDLVFMGSKLREDLSSIVVSGKEVIGYYAAEGTTQEMIVDGVKLQTSRYYPDGKESYFELADFEDITLGDGTIINAGSRKPRFFLELDPEGWQLWYNYSDCYFVVTDIKRTTTQTSFKLWI
jgi:hypothetical protein